MQRNLKNKTMSRKSQIKKTINHYRLPANDSLPKAILCDLDGTIAWMQNRSPYEYHKVKEDRVDERMFELIKTFMLNTDINIIFLTGREGTNVCKQLTSEWLGNLFNGISPYWQLIMRPFGDRRKDLIVKKELYMNHIHNNYDVICVFEDRQSVVDMWRELGLLCCQVASEE